MSLLPAPKSPPRLIGHGGARLSTVFLLAGLFLTSGLRAQGTLVFGNPESFCRNGAFPGGGDYPGPRPVFKLGRLIGPANAKIHFVDDFVGPGNGEDCPRADNPRCTKPGYVIPGDRVLISRTYRTFACGWYQPPRGNETVGWLPVESLSITDPDPNQPAASWLGTWTFGDDSLTVSVGRNATELSVRGSAYWPGRGIAPFHTGTLDATASLRGNTLMLEDRSAAEDFRCKAWLSLVADFLVVADNHKCGGMNVNFDGVYQKARRGAKIGRDGSLMFEEVKMPIVAVFQSPTLTRESYEESVRRLTKGKKTRMESAGDWPVAGLLAHIAGQTKQGFRVVDIWQSEDAFRRFGDMLMPIMKEIGIDTVPEIYEAHAFVSA
jgi:hypothetical protein